MRGLIRCGQSFALIWLLVPCSRCRESVGEPWKNCDDQAERNANKPGHSLMNVEFADKFETHARV